MVRPSLARPSAAAVLAGALLLPACGGDPAPEASPSPAAVAASPSPTPTPSPSPTALDVTAAPDEVDVAYAQAVIDALDAEMAAIASDLRDAGGEFDEDTLARLLSLYTRESQADVQQNWRDYILPRLPESPGTPVTTVEGIRHQTDDCFAIDATRDLSPLGVPLDEVETTGWVMSFRLQESGGGATNPTTWVIDKESDRGLEAPCEE